jgi:hypothetical protein
MTIDSNLTLEIYKGYALGEFDRWDAVVHPDVKRTAPPDGASSISRR